MQIMHGADRHAAADTAVISISISIILRFIDSFMFIREAHPQIKANAKGAGTPIHQNTEDAQSFQKVVGVRKTVERYKTVAIPS